MYCIVSLCKYLFGLHYVPGIPVIPGSRFLVPCLVLSPVTVSVYQAPDMLFVTITFSIPGSSTRKIFMGIKLFYKRT